MKTLILAAFAVIGLGLSVGNAAPAMHSTFQQNYMEGGGG